MSGSSAGEPTAASSARVGPLVDLWRNVNFRRYFGAQLFYSGVFGTMRFLFPWLIVELTDWSSAEGLVLMAFGLPALLVSVPAGAISDRADRRRLYVTWTVTSGVVLVAFGSWVAVGDVTPRWVALVALVLGSSTSWVAPTVSAVVPDLVERDRLMNAVALQNGGGNAAQFVSLVGAGLVVDVLGVGQAFIAAGCAAVIAGVLMLRVTMPPAAGHVLASSGLWGDMKSGARYGFGTEPIRSLLLVALILGVSFSVMQTSMPRVVDQVYGREGGSAALLVGMFGIGMLISSSFVAARENMRHGRNVAYVIGVGLGLGQLLVSLMSSYWPAVVVMFVWGLGAGVAMASHRTLLQGNTDPQMMGRVMGLMMLGFAGGLPLGAAISAILTRFVDGQSVMTIVGVVTMCITLPLLGRRTIRTL
ncbi:MAG: MFS transporter [Actinomycetia bacterium]|nr:MFS transporter [Actinomycetes bacterium]